MYGHATALLTKCAQCETPAIVVNEDGRPACLPHSDIVKKDQ